MRQTMPAQLLGSLLKVVADLPPAQIVKAETALATARRRAIARA